MTHWLKNTWIKLELLWIRYVYERIIIKRQAKNFFYILFGPIYFQALSAAIQFDLFTLLSKHRKLTLAQIADHLRLEHKPTRILLSTLTAIGLIKRGKSSGDAYYSNTFTTDIYLARGKKYSLTSIVDWYHHIVYKPMFSFYDSLKANANIGLNEYKGDEATLYQRLSHYPDLQDIFQAAMQQISAQANELLAKYVDLSNVKRVVDIGGGNGSNLLAIAKCNAHIRGSVFDRPSVCAIAREHLEKQGYADRIGVVEGDCFETAFPTDADCFLFCHFLDIWSEDQNRFLLKKALEALPKGGITIVFDIMEWDNMSGPLTAAAGSPYFLTLATGDGLIYSATEYEQWMREQGYSSTWRISLPQDHIAVMGRK